MFRKFEFRNLLHRVDELDVAIPAAPMQLEKTAVPWREELSNTAVTREGEVAVARDEERIAVADAERVVVVAGRGRGTARDRPRRQGSARRGDRRHAAPRVPDRAVAARVSARRAGGGVRAGARAGAADRGGDRGPRSECRRHAPATRPPARARPRARTWSRSTATSSCRSRRCSPRWRRPGSRSTSTGWARSLRGSARWSRSSSRARTSSQARSSCSGRPSRSGDILFEKLGLTPGRKGKTGYSTDTRVLRSIRGEHEIVARDRGVARVLEAAQHVPRPAAEPDRRGRPAAHDVQPGCCGDRTAVDDESEPAGDPDPHRARPRDPVRVRRRARPQAPLGRLLADRAADPRARLRRAQAARGVRARRGHPHGDRSRGARASIRPS